MKTLVIIPTYNERENIVDVLRRGLDALPDGAFLVVDDASPDGTAEVAGALNHERIRVFRRDGKMGIGSAYLFGFAEAAAHGFDAVVQMDADGSHAPADLPRLIDALVDADVAIGSRRIAGGKIIGWGPHRHLMSFGAGTFARAALGIKTRDITAGFRAFRIDAAKRLIGAGIGSDGYAFQEEVVFVCERLGMRIAEIPVVFRDRIAGTSKLGAKEVTNFFSTVMRLRRSDLMHKADSAERIENKDAAG